MVEMNEVTPAERLRLVQRAAKAIYGEVWPARLAAGVGVSLGLAKAWKAGTRYPGHHVLAQCHSILMAHHDHIRAILRAFPCKPEPLALEPLILDEVPPPAAAPAPAPAAPRPRGRPRKPPTPEKIAAALEDRGYKIRDRGSYPKWYDASMRAKDDADRAAGRVVYTDELMQHAGILDE